MKNLLDRNPESSLRWYLDPMGKEPRSAKLQNPAAGRKPIDSQPRGSRYSAITLRVQVPNYKVYLSQTIATIPNTKAIDILYLGTLDP